MKSRTWNWAGLSLAASTLLVPVAACSGDDSTTPAGNGNGNDAGNADGGGVATPLACTATGPAQTPDSNCTATGAALCAAPAAGTLSPACGKSTSACLALSDNTGKSVLDFRIRTLNLLAPPTLRSFQSIIVTPYMNLPTCDLGGKGSFNWLLRVDTAKKEVTSGGAAASPDPINTGYCFYNGTTPEGVKIQPGTTTLVEKGPGTWAANPATGQVLNMPIFDPQSGAPVVLPLSDPTLSSFTLSADNNCIGSFAGQGAGDNSCQSWVPGGALTGYITLEDADKVPVPTLNGVSLCTVLGASDPKDPLHCPRDAATGKIKIDNGTGSSGQGGDYCSVTKSAGGCGDSFWLSSTFTASAVKLDDSGMQANCIPGNPATNINQDGGAPEAGTGDASTGDAGANGEAGPVDAASGD